MEKTQKEDSNLNLKSIIKRKLNEVLSNTSDNSLRFNNGVFNKSGHNTIYMNDNPIVDFGVSAVGDVTVDGVNVQNAMYIIDYNASVQNQGWGSIGIKFIFDKLPRIQNIILQCFDTACPFWFKLGGEEVAVKNIEGVKHPLRTINIYRGDFKS